MGRESKERKERQKAKLEAQPAAPAADGGGEAGAAIDSPLFVPESGRRESEKDRRLLIRAVGERWATQPERRARIRGQLQDTLDLFKPEEIKQDVDPFVKLLRADALLESQNQRDEFRDYDEHGHIPQQPSASPVTVNVGIATDGGAATVVTQQPEADPGAVVRGMLAEPAYLEYLRENERHDSYGDDMAPSTADCDAGHVRTNGHAGNGHRMEDGSPRNGHRPGTNGDRGGDE